MKNIINLLKTVSEKISYWGFKNILKFIYFEFIYYFKFNSKTLFGIKNEELDYHLKKGENFIEYIPTPYFFLDKSLKKINLDISKTYFVDFGSGAGRVVEYYIGMDVKFATGIEISKKLSDIASSNLSNYSNVELLNIDALDYQITSQDNLFFFYDPFGFETISKILFKIKKSLKENPREINLIYVSPRYRQSFDEHFISIYENINKHNLGMIIYSN